MTDLDAELDLAGLDRWIDAKVRETVSAVVASRFGDNFNAALAKALGET